jgi:glycosyltransferase involved in cell wall biosynthesis
MTSEVAILVPVLRRPQNVEPLLASIKYTTDIPYTVLFICDSDDRDEIAEISRCGGNFICWSAGYASKINIGMQSTDEPYVFLAADDLKFHPGWLEAAAAMMVWPVGVVGTNDLGNPSVLAGRHATHSLVARWYAEQGSIDDPTVFLHEGYRHCFVDNEMIDTARLRGAWAFAEHSRVEHLHPDWGKGQRDEVYDLGRSTMTKDHYLYESRKHLWSS